MQGKTRKNSIAIQGGAFGDEGKGRIVDNICQRFSKRYKKIIVYRWNGGANAGHTVQFGEKRISLHQLPSGVFNKKATVILGKGMVIHPGDLLAEILSIGKVNLIVDEMAVLSLDTHRAFEAALKAKVEGSRGSTGRGIAPAYSDVILRHPLRARDLKTADWRKKVSEHYALYDGLISGLGQDIRNTQVPTLQGGTIKVGSRQTFISRLASQRLRLLSYIQSVSDLLRTSWKDTRIPFVFEGAQAVGLDSRYGVYPDVTASDPTFAGILSSSEGIINPQDIEIRAATIKATYVSSVGTRTLPTKMHPALAELIRRDANEYGATTKRPRDIYNLDLPTIKFFFDTTGATHSILTHLDISYPSIPIQVCVDYKDLNGKASYYRPDQEHLNTLKPIYKEFKPWNGEWLRKCKDVSNLPKETQYFIRYLSKYLGVPPLALTIGPDRENIIFWK